VRQIRKPDGDERLTEDSHLRCTFGLHTPPKPFATVKVSVSQSALLAYQTIYVCEECAKTKLRRLTEEFNNLETEVVGMVKK
jgi:hypothetical protein